MDEITFNAALELSQDVLFGVGGSDGDALLLLNWLDSHKATVPVMKIIGKHTVYFCRRCNCTIYKGDNFCSTCGRGVKW